MGGFGWCDFRALIERHFHFDGRDLDIKYFTAPVRLEHETTVHNKDEHRRYDTWARAVRTISGLKVIEGFHRTSKDRLASGEVRNPDARARSREEKQSDVNIAVEALLDACAQEPPSRVFLLSDDRDLMPVVFALLVRLPKRIPVDILLPSQAEGTEQWETAYQITAERLFDSGVVSRKSLMPKPTVALLSKEMLACSLLRYQLHDHGGSFECCRNGP